MSDHKPSYELNEENSNKNLLEVLLRDYLPYWPVLLVFLISGLLLAKVYLRYQTPMYKVDAGILLKDASSNTDDLLRQAVTGKGNTETEDELEVLKGIVVMKRAVKKAQTQVNIINEGRVKSAVLYYKEPALQIALLNPDSAVSTVAPFTYNEQKKAVYIGDTAYALGQVIDWNGNRLLFNINPNASPKKLAAYKSSTSSKLYLQVFSLEEAASRMQKSLNVQTDKKSSIISMALTTDSKERSKDWLNAIVESYQEETQLEKRKKARFTMDFIDDRLSYVGQDLDSIESELANFKKNNDVQRVSLEAQRVLKKLESGDQLNAQTELQLFVLDDLERYVKGRISKPGMVPSSIGLTDANLNTYFNKLYDAENRYTVALASNGPNNDLVRLIKKEIETYKESLLEIIVNTRNNLMTIQKKALGDYSKYNREYDEVMRSIPSKERELLDITRQQEIKNALYKFLLEKREEAAIQMAGTLSDIRIVREPFGGELVSPKTAQTYGLFGMGFMVLALGVLFIKSSLNNKILSRSELENRTGAPILGEIIEVDTDSPLIMRDGNRSLIAEQFRGLRTNLNFYASKKGARILVTSSIPGEGKSFCATNIALSFALAGKKTVVIESDMRKPNVAKYLKVSRRSGLSVYLAGNATLDEVITQVEDTSNLYVIPAGAIPPNPVELILNGRYEQLLDELSLQYDVVVIDCPPVGLVTDAIEIAKWVDATVFVVRHRHTPREAVENIVERHYSEKKINNMGIVLNGLKGGISGYGYGYNYGYGNGYGYGYGYGYGSSYGYGYGYYGTERKNKFQFLERFSALVFAPFLAFFGIKKKRK